MAGERPIDMHSADLARTSADLALTCGLRQGKYAALVVWAARESHTELVDERTGARCAVPFSASRVREVAAAMPQLTKGQRCTLRKQLTILVSNASVMSSVSSLPDVLFQCCPWPTGDVELECRLEGSGAASASSRAWATLTSGCARPSTTARRSPSLPCPLHTARFRYSTLAVPVAAAGHARALPRPTVRFPSPASAKHLPAPPQTPAPPSLSVPCTTAPHMPGFVAPR